MRSICKYAVSELSMSSSVKTDLLRSIDSAETYHKTDFLLHLGSDKGPEICRCVHCGFFNNDTNDEMPCHHRECKSHTPLCTECKKSVMILPKLMGMLESIKMLPSRRAM